MPAKKRQRQSSLIDRLGQQPYRYTLAQALRILVRLMVRQGVPYDEVYSHCLRFRNSLSLSFPASEIEALFNDDPAAGDPMIGDPTTGVPAPLWTLAAPRVVVTPAFIGLLGGGGALPFHYSVRIAAMQVQDRAAGARAFLDIFSNRMVALFCQAWGKYRLEHQMDMCGTDGQLPLLMALAGVRRGLFDASGDMLGGMTDDVAGYYAGLLRTRPISAHTVSRVLSDYFGVPIELEQFVGGWDYIPKYKLSTLGSVNPALGYGATLGVRTWRHDRKVRLRIGPLEQHQFERFLPRGVAAVALAKMLALFGVPALEYEVRLLLSESCVRPLVLTANGPQAACRLGWNTFLVGAGGKARRPEIGYTLQPS